MPLRANIFRSDASYGEPSLRIIRKTAFDRKKAHRFSLFTQKSDARRIKFSATQTTVCQQSFKRNESLQKIAVVCCFLDFIIPNPDCQPFEAYAFFASKTLTLLTVKFMLVFHAEVEKELSL